MARQRQRRSITQLRHAIDSLPLATRQAMLAGVRASDIIVGAYTDRDGGVCPMLAAHRHGPRGDFLGFARAWDRYTGAGRRARRASEREVRILTMQLEESIAAEQQLPDLAAAVADHRALTAGRERHFAPARESRERPGDPDRRRELRHRPGWSWLRPVRRLEDFEAMLADAGAAEDRAAEREPELV